MKQGVKASRVDSLAWAVVALGFGCRLWLAHATFLNTDEAWHFSAANQDSLSAAYHASLTLAHPPLLVLVLYFWRHLGASNWMLRLPDVLAGILFCWVFYRWLMVLAGRAAALTGLIFTALLSPMIALSAELRQYSFLLLFAVGAAYFLELALEKNSPRRMALSVLSLYLAMLSHYSAFLFAGTLGIYAIARMRANRPGNGVMASWAAGQIGGVLLAFFLYETHISKLGSVYPVEQPLRRFGDFYLPDWYFHAGRDSLVHFLYRGTFGVFRFMFGQTAIGQAGAVLFVGAVVMLLLQRQSPMNIARPRLLAALLALPFFVSWGAVIAGLYPYGRTRQCMFLAIFGFSGVSIAIARLARDRALPSAVVAVVVAAACAWFGALQGRDMLPLADQRQEQMDQAVGLIRSQVATGDTIFTDRATSFQLRHYLCDQKPVPFEPNANGLETFHCEGFHAFLTGPNDGALTPQAVISGWKSDARGVPFDSTGHVWIVQAGWASGLGEALRQTSPEFSQLEIHNFGHYIEVFQLPSQPSGAR